jgi:hypothetical protein
MIVYGGTYIQVVKQFMCNHDWHGPCKDNISLYLKCKKCFCIERDCSEKEYYDRLNEELKG